MPKTFDELFEEMLATEFPDITNNVVSQAEWYVSLEHMKHACKVIYETALQLRVGDCNEDW